MRSLLTILAVLVLSVPALSSPDYLPFPVSVGDKPAMETESSDNFAVVETAVAPSAAMAVKDVEGQIITDPKDCSIEQTVKLLATSVSNVAKTTTLRVSVRCASLMQTLPGPEMI